MLTIQNEYPQIAYQKGLRRGGNQRFHYLHAVKRGGCGLIAASDLLIYLADSGRLRKEGTLRLAYRGRRGSENPLCESAYHRYLAQMMLTYFPLIPFAGKTGWGLAVGMTLYLTRHGSKLKATWGCLPGKVLPQIRKMLGEDIPVILSIGQNVPFFWKREKLPFYRIGADGRFREVCRTRAHFVTVTGIDKEYMKILSWGEEYYIRQDEYLRYMTKVSNPFITNILCIR